MVAWAITAPVVSVTVPLKVPASSCPRVRGQSTSKRSITRSCHEDFTLKAVFFGKTSNTDAVAATNVTLDLFMSLSMSAATLAQWPEMFTLNIASLGLLFLGQIWRLRSDPIWDWGL